MNRDTIRNWLIAGAVLIGGSFLASYWLYPIFPLIPQLAYPALAVGIVFFFRLFSARGFSAIVTMLIFVGAFTLAGYWINNPWGTGIGAALSIGTLLLLRALPTTIRRFSGNRRGRRGRSRQGSSGNQPTVVHTTHDDVVTGEINFGNEDGGGRTSIDGVNRNLTAATEQLLRAASLTEGEQQVRNRELDVAEARELKELRDAKIITDEQYLAGLQSLSPTLRQVLSGGRTDVHDIPTWEPVDNMRIVKRAMGPKKR